ncbi:cupredoxin domain-containing protein [Adhaeribacter sp. BT258]|uniref:Cupredoxin domain-containing protein n=1 Tax=Adhaeribacter terrigena TaxID=2793070 RepID=A0ABS1BZW3_9BACT|nr:plastocyanin/azurin family copper-binding protein [Adhaeribacter terrigena]MBK0402645.1 cupredoxin domain-containing protein [Adhaeribacter terrigena]
MIPALQLKYRVLLLAASLHFYSSSVISGPEKKPVTHTVEIVQMKFKPAQITVKSGDKIVFVNRDMVVHNVTEASAKSWKSPDLATGKSWSMVATKSASYYCTFHPVMKGKITLK